jgi:hypothetical protein
MSRPAALRLPDRQMTTTGRSRDTSLTRAGSWSSGMSVAPGTCPSTHSEACRTSRTNAPWSRSAAASWGVTCAGRAASEDGARGVAFASVEEGAVAGAAVAGAAVAGAAVAACVAAGRVETGGATAGADCEAHAASPNKSAARSETKSGAERMRPFM